MSLNPNDPIPIDESGGLGQMQDFKKEADSKFRSYDALIYAVVAAIVVSAITGLIAVAAIVIDQLHFNNETYREWSAQQDSSKQLEKDLGELKSQVEALKKGE